MLNLGFLVYGASLTLDYIIFKFKKWKSML